ncbi:hypothetical protein [Streptomyces sp. NPDC006335]|uniref:hypothetical protein n=1 Tax=Streptomyces sp. NPDC006335 TaxID=3156895 RepID=UPI0033B43CDD
MTNRLLAGVAAAAVIVGGLTMAPASTAATLAPLSNCSHSWRNASADSGKISTTDVNMRKGPHFMCDIIGTFSKNKVYAHCWDTGNKVHGNPHWWHVRIAGTDTNGWVSEYYLSYSISRSTSERC